MLSLLNGQVSTIPTVLGMLAGTTSYYGLHEKLIKKVAKCTLKCKCPVQDGWKVTRFKRNLDFALKHLKKRTGWNCRRIRITLRPIVKTVDSCLDTIVQIKNPLCQVNADEEESDCMNAVLDMCDVGRPLPYWIVFCKEKIENARKIAEGSYGEIYTTKNEQGKDRVLKFMPVYGKNRDKWDVSFQVQDVRGDVACSKALTELSEGGTYQAPNFPTIYNINLVKGKIPTTLLNSWWEYRNSSGQKIKTHPRPDRYTDDSIFLVMESNHCGECFMDKDIPSCLAALSLVCQVVAALAVAETAFNFEHRDLHLGNLLVKDTDQQFLHYSTLTWKFQIRSHGVQAFVIDFTMSRVDYDHQVTYFDMNPIIEDDPTVPLNTLDEERLYSNHENLYYLMGEVCNYDWKPHFPRTNILWLRHVMETIYRKVIHTYANMERGDNDKEVLETMIRMKSKVLDYQSSMEFLVDAVFHEQKVHGVMTD